MKECLERLNTKKLQVDHILIQQKNVFDQFKRSIEDVPKHEEFLTKLFKRKIKRSKKKTTVSGEEEDESDYASDFSDDEDESPESEDCPVDCPTPIYKQVLALREQRLDHDEILVDIQKSLDVIDHFIA